MSSIIKHNRIHQEGVCQVGCVHKREEVKENEVAEDELEKKVTQVVSLKEEAEKEARHIIESAKKEAMICLEKAQLEIQMMREEQQENSTKERENIRQEEKRSKEMLREERSAMEEEIQELKQQMLAEIEPEVVEVIKKLVERIVDEKILGKAGWLPLIVHKMLTSEAIAESIRIHLSQENYERYKGVVEEALSGFHYPYEVLCHTGLKDTVCMVEVSTGSIYYDIEEGLQEVIEEMNTLQALS